MKQVVTDLIGVSAGLSLSVHPHLQISPDSCKLRGGWGGYYFYPFIQLWPNQREAEAELLSWPQELSGLPQNLLEDPTEGTKP